MSAASASPSAAAPAVGRTVAAPPCARPATRFILPAAAVLVALALAWPQRGQAWPTLGALEDANGAWMAMILLFCSATYVMGSIALLAAAPARIPFGRTFTAQVAAAFTNRLAPAGLGGMATNVRFLELAGATRPGAVAAVGMSSLASLVVHVLALAAVLPVLRDRGAPHGVRAVRLPVWWPWALVLAALAALIAAGLGRRRGWWSVRAHAAKALAAVSATIQDPRRAGQLLVGSAGVTSAYALALVASVEAVGGGVAPLRIVAVYLGASALAAAAPTPGGLGALEAALVAGLVSGGATAHGALAAVMVYRFVTYWLPVLPGWLAFRSLRARGVL